MITVWEVIIGGIWSAAAVTVAGFTWEAYTAEFQGFPVNGSATGGDGSSILGNLLTGGNPPTPAPGQPIPKAAQGGTSLEPDAGLGSGKAPPLIVVQPLIAAVTRHDKITARQEMQRLNNWANTRAAKRLGWSGRLSGGAWSGRIANWAFGQPWFGKLADLTGVVVVQEQ